MTEPALELQNVSRILDGQTILRGVDWTVRPEQRWVVLGRNGSGKSTLIRVASLYLHPSTGTVRVLGQQLGSTDVRQLRTKVGLMSAALGTQLRPDLQAIDIVMTAKNGALEPWWHSYTDQDREQARAALAQMRCEHFAQRTIGSLSSGERQRVLVARSLMTKPGLVLLDEPSASLDLGGREELVASLSAFAGDPTNAATVLVTHHVEEIPAGFTHVLMMRDGSPMAAGPIDDVLTSEAVSECFELAIDLQRHQGRWMGFARR